LSPWWATRPVSNAELLGQSACILLGCALVAWAVAAVADMLERDP
jgi:hypothetical protein